MAVETISTLRFKPALAQYHAACVGWSPGESKRLLRKVLAALAEVKGMIDAGKADDAAILVTASSSEGRTSELHR